MLFHDTRSSNSRSNDAHDSCLNYQNQFVLGRKNCKTMELERYFSEQKTGRCCFMQLNVCAHHVKFRGVFLKLINIYLVTECLVFIALQLLQGKSKKNNNWRKREKNNRNSLSQMFSQIHRKVPVTESHLNIVAGLQLASYLEWIPGTGVFLS